MACQIEFERVDALTKMTAVVAHTLLSNEDFATEVSRTFLKEKGTELRQTAARRIVSIASTLVEEIKASSQQLQV